MTIQEHRREAPKKDWTFEKAKILRTQGSHDNKDDIESDDIESDEVDMMFKPPRDEESDDEDIEYGKGSEKDDKDAPWPTVDATRLSAAVFEKLRTCNLGFCRRCCFDARVAPPHPVFTPEKVSVVGKIGEGGFRERRAEQRFGKCGDYKDKGGCRFGARQPRDVPNSSGVLPTRADVQSLYPSQRSTQLLEGTPGHELLLESRCFLGTEDRAPYDLPTPRHPKPCLRGRPDQLVPSVAVLEPGTASRGSTLAPARCGAPKLE
ncbi:hypothetical protein DFJ73DRAFT_762736 [Zopfochytrium polystomum]|nr:hypothetical protein DFJ73DRAFT_762736 [Zopfochytrium polystomum]